MLNIAVLIKQIPLIEDANFDRILELVLVASTSDDPIADLRRMVG